MPARFKDLCLDAVNDRALADWWCAALGYRLKFAAAQQRAGDGAAAAAEAPGASGEWIGAIEDPSGAGPLIWINKVPEGKSGKNRMHFDVFGDTRELVSMGATLVRARDEEIGWDVLADPEGNEFCVFVPKADAQ